MHARYYSGNMGRFLSMDPVGGATEMSQSWNRYSYVMGNPIAYVDPTGAVVSLAGVDDTDLTKLLEDLGEFTGNEYSVDNNKNLVLLSVGEDSSNTATSFLNELIESKRTFKVMSGDRNTGNFGTGEVEINPASFEGADYGRVNPTAFNIGSTLVHELVHASRPLYDTLDGTKQGTLRMTPDWTSPVVDFVNQIRKERGLPQRASYVAVPAGFFGRKLKLGFTDVNPKNPKRAYYVITKNN